MQTVNRKPVRQIILEDWSRRDKITGGIALGFAVLLIWTLLLVSSQQSMLSAMNNSMLQQQNQISNLQNKVTDNEQKREADVTALMNVHSHAFASPAANNGASSSGSTTGGNGYNIPSNTVPSESPASPNPSPTNNAKANQ